MRLHTANPNAKAMKAVEHHPINIVGLIIKREEIRIHGSTRTTTYIQIVIITRSHTICVGIVITIRPHIMYLRIVVITRSHITHSQISHFVPRW